MDDIKVEGDRSQGRLVISGKRTFGDRLGSLHSSGTSIPSFSRAFSVNPLFYDLDKVSTNLEYGVLTVRLPYLPPSERQKRQEPKATLSPPLKEEQKDDSHILVQRIPSSHSSALAVPAQSGPFSQFNWPPKMEIIPKSDTTPLTFSLVMPEGVSDPTISLRLVNSLLFVDVTYTQRSENELGFSEQCGSFSRTFSLPPGTTRDSITSQFENGKLTIVVKN
jgi:HSP20 family molecular chaperone IbpA